MTLLQLQQRMARAIMQPLTESDRLRVKLRDGWPMRIEANDLIKSNGLTSVERLEIYSRSYWFRVLDSLYEDFPGLRAVLGRLAFHRLSRAYLADCPSRSFTLRNLGSRLEHWLLRNPEYAKDRHALALDMVRLEWAHIEAFDNAAEKVLGPEDLLVLGPRFRVALQPYLRLLALHYPVDDLRLRTNRMSKEHGAASNVVGKQRKHQDSRQARASTRENIFLAVHRLDFTVYYRRLASEEYLLLKALGEGQYIAEAILTAFKSSVVSMDEQRSLLEKWFAAWAELGWLCASARAQRTRRRPRPLLP